MCRISLLMLVLAGAGLLTANPEAPAFRFTKAEVGKLPAGWKAAQTGKGEGSRWLVAADATAPSGSGLVLAQTAASPKTMFNLCVAERGNFCDLEISVAFKAIKGELDQGGGVVWRYQDHDNYYIARMNPLEDNYRFYKVIGGKRIQLATKEELKVPAGQWHTLKVRQQGDRVECYLDGAKMLEATDDALQTAGKVGLWTKADAQTYFDSFAVTRVGAGQ